MRKTTATLLAAMVLAFTSPAFTNWELPFGKEDQRVGVSAPMNEQDAPDGPASYRVVNGNLWVLDSVKGRVLCFSGENKLIQTVIFPTLKPEFILSDFALQLSSAGEVQAVVTVDTRAKEIVVVDAAGKELRRIKADSMTQLDEVDVDSEGRIYVGDYAAGSISVFAADGQVQRSFPWQVSGFVTDLQNNLHLLDYKEGSGHALVTLAADGQEIARQELGMPEMQNPRIWSVNASGERLVSMVPPSGNPAEQVLCSISADGKIIAKADFTNPYYINRYLAAGDGHAWLVKADYLKAPAQSVKIETLSLK